MGITYSIYVAALWPMVALVVKPQVVGSAYGLATSLQNIGLALGPMVVGALTFTESDEEGDTSGINNNAFNYVSLFLAAFSFLGVLSSLGLLISDRVYYGGLLQKPSSSKSNEDHVDILESPAVGNRNPNNLANQNPDLKEYLDDSSKRSLVRKSIARSSVAR